LPAGSLYRFNKLGYKIKSKGKASEEVLDENMQHYLQMYKKQHTPHGIEVVRALVKANA
jgi:hypothetical protein